MSDLDIEIRETYDIPDYIDTITWCGRNGVDYITALHEAAERILKGTKKRVQCKDCEWWNNNTCDLNPEAPPGANWICTDGKRRE